jgi:GDP-D-mannose 3',5'-epimerase
MPKKLILVLGAGGFIGHHLVRRLASEGHWVRGVDLKLPSYDSTAAEDFKLGDLCDQQFVADVFDQSFDEVYQLAADMGGAGYIFSGNHDALVMKNSASINLNVLHHVSKQTGCRVFYSSSACIYPQENQLDPDNPNCAEASAYPANPDSEYGWEKLFSERLYLAYRRNFGVDCKIARFHNIFGPLGAWGNGKEKSPAAICRKVALAHDGDSIEVWGDGKQTRSFLYVDECLDGVITLMRSDLVGPYNIGSEEQISINGLVDLVAKIAGKKISKKYIDGPLGVRGRNSDNRLIYEELGWRPRKALADGLSETYSWVEGQVKLGMNDPK